MINRVQIRAPLWFFTRKRIISIMPNERAARLWSHLYVESVGKVKNIVWGGIDG